VSPSLSYGGVGEFHDRDTEQRSVQVGNGNGVEDVRDGLMMDSDDVRHALVAGISVFTAQAITRGE